MLATKFMSAREEAKKLEELRFNNIINGLKSINAETQASIGRLNTMTSLLNQFNTSFGNAQSAKAGSKEESNVIQAEAGAKNAKNSYDTAAATVEKNQKAVNTLTESVNRLRAENERQVAQY